MNNNSSGTNAHRKTWLRNIVKKLWTDSKIYNIITEYIYVYEKIRVRVESRARPREPIACERVTPSEIEKRPTKRIGEQHYKPIDRNCMGHHWMRNALSDGRAGFLITDSIQKRPPPITDRPEESSLSLCGSWKLNSICCIHQALKICFYRDCWWTV